MNDETEWSRAAWDASVSASAYNPDWWATLKFGEHPVWNELEKIHLAEGALEAVPAWAEEIIRRMMELPMCGYYAFPDNVLQVCEAIKDERRPDIVKNCYTVDPERKTLMSYYVYCLDAWLKDAPLEVAQAELAMRDSLGKDWGVIVSNVYQALGDRSEVKTVLIERLVHRLRWWIKTLIWADDKRDRFGLDTYLGDPRGDAKWGCYGNPPYDDPYFAELRVPQVKALEDRIRQLVSDPDGILVRIQSTWLCAPKVFRYLEKLVHEIGAIDRPDDSPSDSPILQCEDTYPDFQSCSAWFDDFISRVEAWLAGNVGAAPELGEPTPVKLWLASLLRHKLLFTFVEQSENPAAKLIGRAAAGRSGTRGPEGTLRDT